MSNFILIPPPDYVGNLLSLVPDFGESAEFQSLDDQERLSPSLVFSAFAKFMEVSFSNPIIIEKCANAIEHFATTNDSEAHNLLVTEVFEAFRQPLISKPLLQSKSRELYDKWIGN
jgi:hypothetical protein